MKIESKLTVADTDPLVREHRVQDIHILPGVSMLDAIYKTLASADIAIEQVELSDIVFHEPIVTHDTMDRRLTIKIELDDSVGIVKVTSVPSRQGVEQSPTGTLHLTANLARSAGLQLAPLDTTELVEARDLDQCYQVTRKIGIYHEAFMKCLGQVCCLPNGDILAHVRLSPQAIAKADNFLLHPVFMDCATIVPLYHFGDRLDSTNLYIPFAIQGFRGSSLVGHTEVLIRVKCPSQDITGKEILSHSFELYALDGTPIAVFDRFSVKKVHNLGNVRQLLSSGESARNKPSATVAAPPAMPTDEGDPVMNWVIHHLVSTDEVEWADSMVDTSFFDLGLDSLNLLDISDEMSKQLGVELYPTVLFEHSAVTTFAAYLQTSYPDELAKLFNKSPPVPQPVTTAGESAVLETPSVAPQPAELEKPQKKLSILTPRWMAIDTTGNIVSASATGIWTALSADPLATALTAQLSQQTDSLTILPVDLQDSNEALESLQTLWLVNPDHFALFAVIKQLIGSGKIDTVKHMNVITANAFELHGGPVDTDAGHGVWGMLQSLSREYPGLKVCQVDICVQQFAALNTTEQSVWLNQLLNVDQSQDRALFAFRQGHFYHRRLLSCDNETSHYPAIRYQGVYAVIGGASGVGLAFVNYLRRHYDARVAIIGRRAENQLNGLAEQVDGYGEQVIYLCCAVEDSAALQQTLDKIVNRFGQLNGVVHSAMVLDDKPLTVMDQQSLAAVMVPKSEGIRSLATVTEAMTLDFMLIFSSVQSFVGNSTQANYAAASTYIDGYANALAANRDYPVTVVNWGFWQDIGAVANDVHRQLLARQGMYGLVAEEAFVALMQSLGNGWQQMAILSASDTVLTAMGWHQQQRLSVPAASLPLPATLVEPIELDDSEYFQRHFISAQTGMDKLIEHAQQCILAILEQAGITDTLSLSQQLNSKAVAPEFRRLLETLLETLPDILAQRQFISYDEFADKAARLQQQNPDIRAFLPLLSACLKDLGAAISGKTSPFDIVFPQGDTKLVSQVYGQSEISQFYNQILAKAVLEIAQHHQQYNSAQPLRILEIGAGTGASCKAIIDALGNHDFEYCYTDLWDKLVNQAKQRFEDSRFEFKILDIGTDPLLQGFASQFDVIVATNVLHATPSLPTTLLNIKKLLSAQGTLLINESVEVQPFSTYTFGLLPGWWSSKDPANRIPGSPLATDSDWQRLLADIGLIRFYNRVPQTAAFSSQVVLQVQSDGVVWSDKTRRKTESAQLPGDLPSQLVAVTPQQLCGVAMPVPQYLQLYFDHNNNLWLFLHNPPANTFTLALLNELCTVLEALKPIISAKLLYISHFGNYFSLGGDRPELLTFLANNQTAELTLFAAKARQLLIALVELPALVVAVVNGSAQGGGLETLLATDLQLVSAAVKVGLPEIKSGLIPGMGGLTYLSQQIGISKAKNLLLGGELISATEAAACGIISHVVDDPFATAMDLDATLTNRKTAVHIKQRLAPQQQSLLTADLDDWLDYMLDNSDWIDRKRIKKAKILLEAQAQPPHQSQDTSHSTKVETNNEQ
jgi:enoyl-CoA hydratase/carnithine racemase/NAD(P)-dependent dehydrogenase (short-subunit alcohol dehydrogenase family)/acyl carrier protein/ubiquinone/menaquinone biosynthesis C-methylase UbiE